MKSGLDQTYLRYLPWLRQAGAGKQSNRVGRRTVFRLNAIISQDLYSRGLRRSHYFSNLERDGQQAWNTTGMLRGRREGLVMIEGLTLSSILGGGKVPVRSII